MTPLTEYHVQEDQRQNLINHFSYFYYLISQLKLSSDASFDHSLGVPRCITGIPYTFLNAVLDSPQNKTLWDRCIKEQVAYFKKANLPFVWYVNEEEHNKEFQQKLRDFGFTDVGVFRGVAGTLDKPLPQTHFPEGCTIELVQSPSVFDEFNELVCATFAIPLQAKKSYKEALEKCGMYHWIARIDGNVVSAVSTLIQNDMVSFWNGATLPEYRRHGLSTNLRTVALQHAKAKGCIQGSSFLMSEGMALGICTKFGYETKWRFRAFTMAIE